MSERHIRSLGYIKALNDYHVHMNAGRDKLAKASLRPFGARLESTYTKLVQFVILESLTPDEIEMLLDTPLISKTVRLPCGHVIQYNVSRDEVEKFYTV